jgi:predicted transcriptional regulator
MNKRLHRQGQGEPVRCYRILTENTMDQAVSIALESKDATQHGLRAAIKKYREEHNL